MITLNELTFTYAGGSKPEFKNLSLNIAAGECVLLCGPSGAGKTTLLRLMSGLIPEVYPGELQGQGVLAGKDVASLSSRERAQLMGLVLQDPRSQFFMNTVRDEIAFSGENLGYAGSALNARVEERAFELGISHLLDQELNHLSSGEKQKVALAGATLLNPRVLFLDEPSANLDNESYAELLGILERLKAKGTTIVISEHRLHQFLPLADRFLYVGGNAVVKDWSASQFQRMSLATAMTYGLRHPAMEKELPAVQTSKPTASADHLIVEDLSFAYTKDQPLHHATSLCITKGEITYLTGDNGTGKTTLARIICGLLKEKAGTISARGRPLRPKERRRQSYFVMQDADYQLYADSVEAELFFGRRVTKELQKRAGDALALFDLLELKERHPASLSGGEKQRLTLACALCSDAELVVLDEPTSGLDYHNAKRVVTCLKQLQDEGRMVVVITHDRTLYGLITMEFDDKIKTA